jgi:hypothetical protein
MVNEYELINELNSLCDKLTVSGRQLAKYGNEKAQAEHDYKITLRQEALKLRATGEAIGMINMTVYGIPEVAEKRLKRDIAETMYDTCKESINVLKLKIRILDAQISREWGSAKNG